MELPKTVLHALHHQAARHPDRSALWSRREGYYLPISWREYAERVKRLALAFHGLGIAKGDAVGIFSFNREEWVVSDLAAIALGAVPVGLYATLSPEQIQFVLHHSEAKAVVVENRAMLQRVLEVRPQLPRLRHLILLEVDGGDLPEGAIPYAQLIERGRNQDEAPYWSALNDAQPDDLATLIYTSGTTGNPKGVMLSHRNLTWTSQKLAQAAELGEEEIVLSYLPLSHIAEQLATIHLPLVQGAQVYFAQSVEKMPENLKQVRPTVFFGVPRVWEKFKGRAEERMAQLPPRRARLLRWARRTAALRTALSLGNERVPWTLDAQYRLAQRLVFAPMKERIGFDRTRVFITSAAPIGRDVLDFFASVDIVLREVYGQSEVSGPTTLNSLDSTRLGSLGRPMIGVEVRIAEDGEILVRGENVCLGYFKEPEASSELISDGWLHSGDVGEFDPEGYLRITGRKKEIIVTSGGKKTAPAHIEGLLKAIAPVGNALVVGDKRNFLVALLALDPEKAPGLAREKGWPEDLRNLSSAPQFLAYLDERIRTEVNARLSKFETIKRFAVLAHDFTVEGGELTPTLKVRRKVVEEKYRAQIDGLYGTPVEPTAISEAQRG
ncbi:MAG: long-chain fatty acid--CoA ligase [Myxococcota bacterium]|nr:long-chain fatty acid--CoA ligase [Myxococcota bacterium]